MSAGVTAPTQASTLTRRANEGLCGMFGHTDIGSVTKRFAHVTESDMTKEVGIGNKLARS